MQRSFVLLSVVCGICTWLSACATSTAASSTNTSANAGAPDAGVDAVALLHHEAEQAAPLATTLLARQFVAQVQAGALPHVEPREIFRTEDKKRYFTAKEAAALPESERKLLQKVPVNDEVYYYTKYGSPLSYTRPLDLLGQHGVQPHAGTRYLDFGYGYVGHLRMLAGLGWDTTGVDVDPFLRALYSEPSDQGAIGSGHVTLVDGHFPNQPDVVARVGSGYQIILSKNVLKKGYIHPDRPADDKYLIHLGIDDAAFLKGFFDALEPGGLFLVYNICPALTPADKPFVPWSDGRSPFTKEQWEAAGFEVLVFDQDDTAAIRALGHALGWDAPGDDAMDLQHDLSVLYTLVRRPAPPK